jgi:hypothetical protein
LPGGLTDHTVAHENIARPDRMTTTKNKQADNVNVAGLFSGFVCPKVAGQKARLA